MNGSKHWERVKEKKKNVFKLSSWRWLPRVLWTERKIKYSILEEISECFLETIISKQKLTYSRHLKQADDGLENDYCIVNEVKKDNG